MEVSTVIFDGGSYKAACFLERRLGLTGGNPQVCHHVRGFHMPARLEEHGRRCRVIEPRGDHYDSLRTLLELSAVHSQIDHHVSIDLSEPDHGTGSDHVQDEFLGGPGFHSCRSHDHFGADHRADGNVNAFSKPGEVAAGKLRAGIRGDEYG